VKSFHILQREPQVDSSVLVLYESIRDKYPECEILPMPEKEYRLLYSSLVTALEYQNRLGIVCRHGEPLCDSRQEDEGIPLYQPFKDAYLADDAMRLKISQLLTVLEEHSQRIIPSPGDPYYLVPFPDWSRELFPFILQGASLFVDKMMHDLFQTTVF